LNKLTLKDLAETRAEMEARGYRVERSMNRFAVRDPQGELVAADLGIAEYALLVQGFRLALEPESRLVGSFADLEVDG
jgi:hypothetical protein